MDQARCDAIADIMLLKARYFRFVDTKQWAALAALFTPDATMFFPEAQDAPQPLTASIEIVANALEGAVSVHHGHMPEIEILGPDRARGIWAMEDRVFWPSDRPSVLGLETLHGYGHYHEDYERHDGRWLIRRMKITRLWTRAIPPARSVA